MNSIKVEGNVPLNGSVDLSGSAISASKLIIASLYTVEDVILDNVPRVGFTESEINLIQSLGGTCEWIGEHKLKINTSGVNTYRVPFEIGSKNRASLLAAGPLLYRFGKALIPKPVNTAQKTHPIDRFISTWEALGFKILENPEWINIESSDVGGKDLSFKVSTHMGTENAILSSLFLKGVTTINNSAEEPEIDDLIGFLNEIGADVKRTQARKIEINGSSIYKGGAFSVQSDKNEAVFFATSALVTGGNVTLKNVNKTSISSFLSLLNNIGANFEFQGNDLTVWRAGETFSAFEVTSKPASGFITDWMSSACILATCCNGESSLYEGVYADAWDYIKDINRMGARIDFASDDPQKILVKGPTPLKGATLDIENTGSGLAMILASLKAESSSEIRGFEFVELVYENLLEKLRLLNARISE